MPPEYDASRATYALTKQTDPRIATAIEEARGDGLTVVFTYDVSQAGALWLVRDYLPQLAELEGRRYPSLDAVAGPGATVTRVPIPHDCRDPLLGAFWRRPERYLEPSLLAACPPLAELAPEVRERGLARLRNDLEGGAWQRRYGGLLSREELDVGYRLVATPR